jgi:hypothetical protein
MNNIGKNPETPRPEYQAANILKIVQVGN